MGKDARAVKGSDGRVVQAKKTDHLLLDPEDVILVTDPNHPLYDDRVHEVPTDQFIANVDHSGVIEPVIGRRDPETAQILIEDGRKRTLGLRAANKLRKKRGDDLRSLPVIVKRGSDGDAVGRMISLNEMRTQDTPLNLARKIAKAIDLGKTEDEVALMCGKSVTSVKNMLALLDAPAAVRNAVDAGKITASAGYKLAKMEVGEAKNAVEKLVEHAPRTPGKKRSSNAKKARAILDGGRKKRPETESEEKLRGRNQIENVAKEVADGEKLSGPAKEAIGKFAAWILGDDAALSALV